MKKVALLIIAAILAACGPDEAQQSVRDVGIFIQQDSLPPDLRIIDHAVDQALPDVLPAIDPCENPDISDHEQYCLCRPQCCSNQEWWCPPNPDNSIQSMRVVVEICNDSAEQCEFGTDPDCPPPQIIHQSECQVAFECPPGSTGDFLRWFECQLPDGRTGQQRVLCDKGRIIHGPCTLCEPEVCDAIDNDCDGNVDEDPIPCTNECGPGIGLCINGEIVECVNREPEEEVCNGIDDDCDALVDEGQRNACDECGPVPPDDCDGIDNDCDGSTDENLVRQCETACGLGVESCIAGRWVSCTARQPIDEECDGLDNDCDGIPDEGINCLCTIDQVGALFPCSEQPLVCGMGFKTCECLDVDCELLQMGDCKALCAHLPPVEGQECDPRFGTPAQQEICNNFDEDCDELLDEQLTQACYTGPRDTLNVGICISGEQTCFEGQWGAADAGGVWAPDLCGGEITPQEEICNGADDNCDGEVDYGEQLRPTDILFIVDTSGSMTGEIRAVTQALSRFGQHFSAENVIHWGLIIGPTRAPSPEDPRSNLEVLTMVSNISPFDQFFQRFINLDTDNFDGGLEMLMDATMLSLRNLSPLHVDLQARTWVRGVVSVPTLDQFFIQWRQNTDRIIILFSDEDEQSYMNPEFHRNDLDAALNAAPNTKLYTFALGFYGWDELAVSSGGRHFNLTANPAQTYNDLMSILDEICLPREAQAQEASHNRIMRFQLASYYSESLPGMEFMCY